MLLHMATIISRDQLYDIVPTANNNMGMCVCVCVCAHSVTSVMTSCATLWIVAR